MLRLELARSVQAAARRCLSDDDRMMQTARVALVAVGLAALSEGSAGHGRIEGDEHSIRPWAANPRYWEYKGRPALLLGGSDDDNLFQWPADRLDSQLTLLRRVGGNYVRNTMSDRRDGGFEQYPFRQRPDGKYDLNSWNDEYWTRFERFLQATNRRDIIVQIEVWDRFDYSGANWPPHPYNPINNVNYTREASGLAAEYPEHPGANAQPFFFTTPHQRNIGVVLRYQQRFVDRLLAHTLKYGHVLYCIDNETSGDAAWGRYWAEYIKAKARAAARRVQVTEMWDDWDVTTARHRQTLDHPDLYDFADLSQNNHHAGRQHWRNALWVRQYVAGRPRPLNAVKTYGADGNRFGHTDRDGLERFFRHVLAGFAAVRFHRPDSGLGLKPKAQSAIAAVRALESVIGFLDLTPSGDVLSNGRAGDVYTSMAGPTRRVLYFPSGGQTTLPLAPGQYELVWIGLQGLRPRERLVASGGADQAIVAPDGGHWFAVLQKR
jgi:hypothetical protein